MNFRHSYRVFGGQFQRILRVTLGSHQHCPVKQKPSKRWFVGFQSILPDASIVLLRSEVYAVLQQLPVGLLGYFEVVSCTIFSNSRTLCKDNYQGLSPGSVIMIIGFILPCVIILINYGYLWFYMWKNHRYLKKGL